MGKDEVIEVLEGMRSGSSYKDSAVDTAIECVREMETITGDYRERLKAEHTQLTIKLEKLKRYLSHYKADLKIIDVYLMEKQLEAMTSYRNVLELRLSMDE